MQAWPADKVERWPIDRLVPYARNARTHSDAQVAQIAGSIREWGWTMPMLVDEDGTLIAGHGRVLAARQLGLTEMPVMVARGWSEAQKRAYVIADNKLALNAGWDVRTAEGRTDRPQGAWAPISTWSASPMRSSPNCSPTGAPVSPIRTTSRRRSRAGIASRAMSGCSGSTGWSAATAPMPRAVVQALNGAKPS